MNDREDWMKSAGIDNEGFRKILVVLFRSDGPAPLGYISVHAKIPEPLELLRKMEEMDLVCQCPNSGWSCCMSPLFEITSKAKDDFFT